MRSDNLDPALEAVLQRSRSLGFLGPGSLRVHVDHALGYTVGLPTAPGRFLDLGSGGGVPGLVLALHWTHARAVLLEASERRCAFLESAVAELGCEERVTVVRARAEQAGRRQDLRGAFDTVVARAFGAPATTAECGAPFLVVGGRLIVSEPPAARPGAEPDGSNDEVFGRGGVDDDVDQRWPTDGLAQLGLVLDEHWRSPYGYRSFVLARTCPDRYPRRDGVPTKRPLF